jgi:hypothetical protein
MNPLNPINPNQNSVNPDPDNERRRARRRGALMTSLIRVPDNLQSLVIFPVAHNFSPVIYPGLSPGAIEIEPFQG